MQRQATKFGLISGSDDATLAVGAAVSAAASAFPAWSRMPASGRAAILQKMMDALDAHREEFYALAAKEVGASHSWTSFNIDLAIGMLAHVASLGPALEDREVLDPQTGKHSIIRRQPAGVVLGMVPWNAPITLGVRAIASALMCGNTVVMKGSEHCPETHQHLVDVLNGAGLPQGVLSCVVSLPEDAHKTMAQLIAHPCIRRVNFTGSTRVGRDVAMEAARHLKPVLLELSGKAPLIVLDDADLDAAVEAACFGAFFNQGQICMSTDWIIVVKSVADAFVAKLQARTAQIRAADPVKETAALGRLISADAAQRVKGLIEDAVSKGARLLTGGQIDGCVMQPALLDGIAANMRIYREETFGPLASIMRVHDAEEAVSIANDSDFGLNAAIFTRDLAGARTIADRLEYGVVQINGPTVHDDPSMPFGGMKQSGHGRFGGEQAISEFTEMRWIATHQDGQTPTL
ncbi:aldehyde dehydrogenase [Roseicitreum antarcticum]|uniref:Vanillin dehydrogenase n=1 Tax=Roseicitreum antarcticum TaxID=564137 RepID=A0A1H3B1Y8_9RHOB|nr:aldehyde dehydrogenase [Roseicitreum antarcticum]SDX35815.1 vanillin dehydrogenase [Roseicitreum antarcticum]